MIPIYYHSTRGSGQRRTFSQAVLQGIGEDSGLFVPETMPSLDRPLSELVQCTYQELAYEILKRFCSDFTQEELQSCILKAYDDKFDTETIAPLVEKAGVYFLELYHGKTLAFKDMALSLLPHLMKLAAKKNGIEEQILILTATSGDTGKAAMEGFANVEGTGIAVFYPYQGVSPIQEKQMLTQKGTNTHVLSVKGNFDDAQTGVKEIFANQNLNQALREKGLILSSANSINIGRLAPQTVYYFHAYGQLVKQGGVALGEPVNFTVPTGNFGNILAGYYAKEMGLPIRRLICASNTNNVLYDFFRTGAYNRNRPFQLTVSPSMDILVSSNLERLLYHTSGDASKIKTLMEKLRDDGVYQFKRQMETFEAEYASEAETFEAIREGYRNGYLMDTHTAVGYRARQKYMKRTGDQTKNIILSTASPYKFADSVCQALEIPCQGQNSFEVLNTLEETSGVAAPKSLTDLAFTEESQRITCKKEEMEAHVMRIAEGMKR